MNSLISIRRLGQSLWLDFISRQLLTSGELEQRIDEDMLGGVTSNPAIFERAIGGSTDYDKRIGELAQLGESAEAIYTHLMIADIQMACDLFRSLYERNENPRDGYVSIEVSPTLAYDTLGTLAEARQLWQAVGRPNVMIKVPATVEGLPVIEQLTAEGINVNVTLIFGLERYRLVAEAYLSGLEKRHRTGESLNKIDSVASFFLSRIDGLIDPLLAALIENGGSSGEQAQPLIGQVAIASAKQAYQLYKELFSGSRWEALQANGANRQRLLWASTGNKNPAYDELKYVEGLIGPQTINTVPVETIAIFKQRGLPANRLEQGLPQAQAVLNNFDQTGLDLQKLTDQLVTDGVQKFISSLNNLLNLIEKKRLAAVQETRKVFPESVK